MRSLRALPLLAVLGLLVFSASSSGAVKMVKPCAVPDGWRLVARDRQAVVIRQPRRQLLVNKKNKKEPAFEYCSLLPGPRMGQFVSLRMPGPNDADSGAGLDRSPVLHLELKGRYVAYRDSWLFIRDTKTGDDSWFIPSGLRQAYVFSRNGVVAAISTAVFTGGGNPTFTMLWVLTPDGSAVFDQGPDYTTTLANLQLYNCSAGCPPKTVTVAWTNNGQQRYAQASGLDAPKPGP